MKLIRTQLNLASVRVEPVEGVLLIMFLLPRVLEQNPFLMAKQLPVPWGKDCRTWPPTLPLPNLFPCGKTRWAAQP